MMMLSPDETKELIARAKSDTEALRQIEHWVRKLSDAHDARRQLLDVPPDVVLQAMEQSQ